MKCCEDYTHRKAWGARLADLHAIEKLTKRYRSINTNDIYFSDMKIVQTEIFGDVPSPDDFSELMTLIWGTGCGESAFNTRMWRGQANIEWRVDSGLYRKLGTPNEKELSDAEEYLLVAATHRGFRNDNGRSLSDIELLARLQHHGAATRLLDTSRNALVGLWFAVASNMEKTGLLVGIHTNYLIGSEGKPLDTPYEELIKRMAEKAYPFTWEPPSVSQRIAAQHSQFLLSSVSDSPMGSIRLPNDEGATLLIGISPTLKIEVKKMLAEVFDIHRLTLFPDLDGFCAAHDQRSQLFANERW